LIKKNEKNVYQTGNHKEKENAQKHHRIILDQASQSLMHEENALQLI